jgi:hypothetical protein
MVQHISMAESNHFGLLICMNISGAVHRRGTRRRPFRYENMWRRHHSYYDTVSKAWNVGCVNLNDVLADLGSVQRKLISWDHDEFGNVRKGLVQLRQQLEDERKKNLYSSPSNKEWRLMNRLAELLAREEVKEKQRSRIDWLKAEDQNTCFFHAKVKQCSRTNKILHLKCADGSLCIAPEEIEEMTIGYYKSLHRTRPY